MSLKKATGVILGVFSVCCICCGIRLMAADPEPVAATEAPGTDRNCGQHPGVGILRPNGGGILREIHDQKAEGHPSGNALLANNDLGLLGQEDPSYCCRGPYGRFWDPCRAGGGLCSSCQKNGCDGHCVDCKGKNCSCRCSGCRSCKGGDDDSSSFCGESFCGPPGRFWIRADYLAWWTNGTFLPPLVTTSPADTAIADAGVLPNATILFGNTTVNTEGRSGARVTVGYWLNCDRTWGLEGDFFDIGGLSTNYSAASSATGSPILARPFFDVDPATGQPRQASEIVSYPNQFSGNISVSDSDYLQSAGFNLRGMLCCGNFCGSSDKDSCEICDPRSCRMDVIAGYRFYRLNDSLLIHENVLGLAASPFPDTTFDVTDSFRTINEFHGVELGLVAQTYRGPWSFEFLAKMALGNNHQTINLNGATTITQRNANGAIVSQQSYNEGVYVLGTNTGGHSRDDFVVIPQLGMEIGYQITDNWRAFLGYNFLYWATVAKAADQIDQNIDSARIPPPTTHQLSEPFPAYNFHASNFWAQGINGGVEFRY
jgi:hypothetical protein